MDRWFEIVLGAVALTLTGLTVYSAVFFAFIEFVIMIILLFMYVFAVALKKRFLMLIFFLLSLLNTFYLYFSGVSANVTAAAMLLSLLGMFVVVSGFKTKRKPFPVGINKKTELAKQLGSLEREEPRVEIIRKRTRKK